MHDGDADHRVEAGGAEGEEQSIHQRHLLPVLAADGQQLLAPVAAQQAQAARRSRVAQVLAVSAAHVQHQRVRGQCVKVVLHAVPLRVPRGGEVGSDLVVHLRVRQPP